MTLTYTQVYTRLPLGAFCMIPVTLNAIREIEACWDLVVIRTFDRLQEANSYERSGDHRQAQSRFDRNPGFVLE